MFLWPHSQRENTQYWHLCTYWLGEDHSYRANIILHRTDSWNARGKTYSVYSVNSFICWVKRYIHLVFNNINTTWSWCPVLSFRWRARTGSGLSWTPWSWRDRGESPFSRPPHTPCGTITTSTSLILLVGWKPNSMGEKCIITLHVGCHQSPGHLFVHLAVFPHTFISYCNVPSTCIPPV